jgi:general secretion pathway protein D
VSAAFWQDILPEADSAPKPIPPPVKPLADKSVGASEPGAGAPGADHARTPNTLHVDETDVRKVLEILSRQGNLRIMVSPSVSGQVTLDLRDLTVDQALEAILKLCHLVARRENDGIYIYTQDELRQRDEEELCVRVYRLNYVKGVDLVKIIKPLLSKRGTSSATPQSEIGIKTDGDKAGGDSMAGGEVLIVQDCQRVLGSIDKVVADLDAQPVQVLIEAVIVRVKLEQGRELGVNFAVLDGAQNAMLLSGSGAAINAATGFAPAQVLTAGGQLVGDKSSGFAENMHGLKFGFVDKNVTGFIRALETVGETRILACPRILVLNKQRAEIQLGDRLGYRTLTQTQTSTVEKIEFMNVGTQLRLRPFVSTDGIVRMEIHPERSSGKVIDNIPQTNTSEVTTNVMIPDGSTIVIGGLMENVDEQQMSGVPGLDRLPLVGPLFRYKQKSSTQNELIVILTPHIWKAKGSGQPPADAPPPGVIPSPSVPRCPDGSAAACPLHERGLVPCRP